MVSVRWPTRFGRIVTDFGAFLMPVQRLHLLGTVMLSVLSGHPRYAQVTALRCDPVNPPLLGMRKIVSEGLASSVRSGW
jgi:hypothetical protein